MSLWQILVMASPWVLVYMTLDWANGRDDGLLLIFLALTLVPSVFILTIVMRVYFGYKNRHKSDKLKTKIYNDYARWDPRRYL